MDVSLVLPGDLPPDPWGTVPAGLQPSLEELSQLGVLQAEMAGLAAAAEACRDAAEAGSPWSQHTPSSSSRGGSPGGREVGSSWEEEAVAGGGGVAGEAAGAAGGTGGAEGGVGEGQTDRSGQHGTAAGAAEAGSKGREGDGQQMQIIGFFQ